MSIQGPDRVLRGLVSASAATAVALLGHLVAGGPAPGWLGLLLPWWLSVTLCTALAGRTVSLPRLSAGVMLSQGAFHALFVLGSPAGMLRAPSPGAGHGHHHHLDPLAGSSLPADPAHLAHGAHAAALPHLAHAAHLTPAMLLGHVLAAAITIALLHRGETGLLRAARIDLAGRRLARLLDALVVRSALALVGLMHAPSARQASASPASVPGAPTAAGPLPSCVEAVLAGPEAGRAPPVVLVA